MTNSVGPRLFFLLLDDVFVIFLSPVKEPSPPKSKQKSQQREKKEKKVIHVLVVSVAVDSLYQHSVGSSL